MGRASRPSSSCTRARARARSASACSRAGVGRALLLAALVLAASTAASALPSLPAFAARYADAVVVFYTSEGARAGTGFFVATRGVAVASVEGAAPGAELVVELSTGERRRARVLAVDPEGPLVVVELVRLPKDEAFAALGLLRRGERARGGAWLIGMGVDDAGRAAPVLGGLRQVDATGRWHLDLPAEAGTPILDEGGRVVAVVVKRVGRTASRGVAVERVRALVEGLGLKRRERASAPPSE